MGRANKWNEEKIKQYILNRYEEEGWLSSVDVPSRVRQLAIKYWGGWHEALKVCGIENAKAKIISQKTAGGAIEISPPDKEYTPALCWECFRPISPKENYCPWHDHFELPKGARFFRRELVKGAGRCEIAVVVECPLFIKETDELRRASRREMLVRIGEGYLQSSHGRGNYKVRL